MDINYTDNASNISEIIPYVITEKEEIVAGILNNPKCYFYDTCSFRKHANLKSEQVEYLLRYIKKQNSVKTWRNCILNFRLKSFRINKNKF